jgi:KDO2-lipid IV(A) lauroyltransferase
MTENTRDPIAATGSRGWARRVIGNPLEAFLVGILLTAFRLMGVDRASATGAAIARTIGPLLRVTNRARRNLRAAFPDMTSGQVDKTVRAMWDNLGRYAAEIACLDAFDVSDASDAGGRIEVVGREHLEALRDDGKGGIVFSAHLGSWDVVALAVGQIIPESVNVYRPLNNPIVDRMVQNARAKSGGFVGKGIQGARAMIAGLSKGRHFAMLVDQKMNDGIAVPFFGRDAMTAPALARFAIRAGVPIVPSRCERLGGARFRLTFYPPVVPASSGNEANDVAETMAEVNEIIEGWITERPEQWLWVHSRWPD